jgi:hypothetical protein
MPKFSAKDVTIALPPVKAGWTQLDKPDDKYGKYSVNTHNFSIDELADKITAAVAPLLASFPNENPGTEANVALVDIEGQIRDLIKVNEKDTFGPYIRVSAAHKEGISKKSGKAYVIRPTIWDAKKQILDPAAVGQLRGGTVIPVVEVGLILEDLPKGITATLPVRFKMKLKGVIVLKAAARTGALADIDISAMVEEYGVEDIDDDLSAYLGTSSPAADKPDPYGA